MVETLKTPELQVTKNTFKNIDEKTQKTWEDFVKAIKAEKEKEKIKTAFEEQSTAVLTSICDSMLTSFETIDATKLQTYKNAKIAFEEDMKTLQIDPTQNQQLKNLQDLIDLKQINTITDKVRLEALKTIAEEKKEKKTEEIKKENKIIKNDIIDPNNEIKKTNAEIDQKNAKRETVITEIEKQIKVLDEQEESKINTFKNMNITKENAKTFFEGNQTTYNAFLEQVFKETNTPPSTENKITIKNDSKGNANTLYERVKTYTEITDLWDITVGKAGAFDNKDGINARFWKEERVIQYTKWTEKKFLVQGSYKEMQERIAENNKERIKSIDRTTQYRKIKTGEIFNTEDEAKAKAKKWEEVKQVKSSLNVFDDIGNFAAFKLYLNNKANAEEITSNLGQILKQITTYTPSTDTADYKDDKTTELKNGYANAMTDYIINNVTDANMLEVYMSYISVNNLNLLWADQQTRSANYTKLFFSDANKGTIRPQIENLMKTKGDSYKMDLLQKIANVKNAIEWPKVKWFDSLIQAFGPMVISILKLLGFGKSSLLKIFPQAKDKINEQFKKEYELNKKQKEFIDDINKNDNFPKNSNPDNKVRLDTWDELKKHFTEEKIKAYKTLIEAKENIKNINVNVFQKGLNIYNKKQKEEKADHIDININDIVTIETKKVDGREKKFITAIKDTKAYENVLNTIIDADETRTRIASANTAIQTPSKENPNINEQWIDNQAKTKYKISNQNDIARYLTASLFSDKDLDYVMTENYLDNGEIITNSTANSSSVEVETTEKNIIKTNYIDTDKTTLKNITSNTKIQDIFEWEKERRPKKIKVNDAIAIKKDIGWTTTYVPETTTTTPLTMNNRVKIKNWDKIEEVKPEVETTNTAPAVPTPATGTEQKPVVPATTETETTAEATTTTQPTKTKSTT